MKYLKIYENFEERTLDDYLNEQYGTKSLFNIDDVSAQRRNINSLKGIERVRNATWFNCGHNPLGNLKGIEILTKVKRLYCWENDLNDLKGIENLTTMTLLSCFGNNLINLKEIEGLENLETLFCFSNQLKNIHEIRKLPNLKGVECDVGEDTYANIIQGNPWESILPADLIKKFDIKYAKSNIERFTSYEFQKEFLEEHPERIKDLESIGFDDKIIKEYGDLINFFNVKL